jgi:hypothetical protein
LLISFTELFFFRDEQQTAMATDVDLLQSLFYHLVLPPRLPSTEDTVDLAPEFTRQAVHAVRQLQQRTTNAFLEYDHVLASLTASLSLQVKGGFGQDALLEQFARLQNHKDAFLFLSVAAQNTGLLMFKKTE